MPFVCFGSFQDYLGKNEVGGIKSKNEWVHTINWDCVILDEYHYEPPIKHQAHGTHVLLIYTLHEWQDFNYLWGHFDITIDFRVLDDGSNIEKVFHGFVFHYGTFIYDKNGEIIN